MTTATAQKTSVSSENEIRDALVDFVANLAPDAKGAVTPQSALLGSGLLDSLGILQLTTFLSDTYGVEIEDEDFTPETFATIESLAAFAAGKLARAA